MKRFGLMSTTGGGRCGTDRPGDSTGPSGGGTGDRGGDRGDGGSRILFSI